MTSQQATKSGKTYRHVLEILAAQDGAGKPILEIGCGGNQYAALLKGNHIGLDYPKVQYAGPGPDIGADAQALPLKNESFELIFMVAVLHTIPDVPRVLRNCQRVLKPGGRLIIFDYNYATTKRLRDLTRDDQWVWSRKDLRRLVQAAGFKKTQTIWDYQTGSHPLVVGLQKFKLFRWLRYMLGHLREGWNIVLGIKLGD